MTVNYKKGHIESCILVAEIGDSKQRFNVDVHNIENGIKTIIAAYDYVGRPCQRVYISGFDLVTDNTNLTKEGIIARVAFGEKQRKATEVKSPLSF